MDSTKKYIIKYKQFAAFCDLYWYVVAVFVQHYAYARIGEMEMHVWSRDQDN